MKTEKTTLVFSLILVALLFNCTSKKPFENSRLYKHILEENPKSISYDQILTVSNNDTVIYNQVRFKNRYSLTSTQKALYQKYGKWDQTLVSENINGYTLAWKGIELFSNEDEFTVLASSNEERNNSYASVIVLDENGNDIAINNNTIKQKIALVIGEMIWSTDLRNHKFNDAFYADRDTSHYNNKKNENN